MKAIEIFKPGKHTAMSGDQVEFSEGRLQEAAKAYDPALHEAPIVVGHPRTDQPAYGWVESLAFAEGSLQAKPRQVDERFAELIRQGRFKKVSASFYRPDSKANPKPGVYYLRHVGFLGAQPPAVKGLRQVEFSEADEDVVELEFGETERTLARVLRGLREWVIELAGTRKADEVIPNYQIQDLERQDGQGPEYSETGTGGDEVSTEEQRKEIRKEVEAEFAERERKLAEAERQRRREAHEQAVDKLVSDGRVLPRHKDGLVQFMEAVDGGQAEIEFAEGAEGGQAKKLPPADWLTRFLAELPQAVDYSERGGGSESDGATGFETPEGHSVDPAKARLHKQALEYQEKHQCDYITAVSVVSKQGGE